MPNVFHFDTEQAFVIDFRYVCEKKWNFLFANTSYINARILFVVILVIIL